MACVNIYKNQSVGKLILYINTYREENIDFYYVFKLLYHKQRSIISLTDAPKVAIFITALKHLHNTSNIQLNAMGLESKEASACRMQSPQYGRNGLFHSRRD